MGAAPLVSVPPALTAEAVAELLTESSRLANDYGDGYEVMCHMSELADALSKTFERLQTIERAAILALADEAEKTLYLDDDGLMDAAGRPGDQETTVHGWLRAKAATLTTARH
jgi:hypothetical protein